jgi:hypothetical protein
VAADGELAQRVREFVADEVGYPLPKVSLETRLLDDVGLAGLDADEFFLAFGKTFRVDPESLDWRALADEFGCEGWWYCGSEPGRSFLAITLTWGVLCLLLELPHGAFVVGSLVLVLAFGAAWGLLRRSPPTQRPDATRVKDLVEAAAAGRWVKGEAARPR